MRKRDYQKGIDVVLWLLGAISEKELKKRIEMAKNGKFYTDYSDEWFANTIFPEM